MKHSIYLIALITFTCTLVGCSNLSYYYQVYETTLPDNVKMDKNNLYYEDQTCIITYDFWSNGGDIGFAFYNKSDKYVYLNLEESFFIKNGIVNDYYMKRTYSSSQALSTVNNVSNSTSSSDYLFNSPYMLGYVGSANSITYYSSLSSYNSSSSSFEESKIICIPPNTYRYFSEYRLTNSVYRSCNIYRYPGKKDANKENFELIQSPLRFGNIISYSFKRNSEDLIRVENNFFVNSVTNYRKKEIIESKKINHCNEGYVEGSFFIDSVLAPNKFYIEYVKKVNDFNYNFSH